MLFDFYNIFTADTLISLYYTLGAEWDISLDDTSDKTLHSTTKDTRDIFHLDN